MISYDPFWKTIADRGISTYALINRHGILPARIPAAGIPPLHGKPCKIRENSHKY